MGNAPFWQLCHVGPCCLKYIVLLSLLTARPVPATLFCSTFAVFFLEWPKTRWEMLSEHFLVFQTLPCLLLGWHWSRMPEASTLRTEVVCTPHRRRLLGAGIYSVQGLMQTPGISSSQAAQEGLQELNSCVQRVRVSRIPGRLEEWPETSMGSQEEAQNTQAEYFRQHKHKARHICNGPTPQQSDTRAQHKKPKTQVAWNKLLISPREGRSIKCEGYKHNGK